MSKINFNSVKEYSQFLAKLMATIASKGDFNILVHQVGSHRTFLFDNKQEKIEGINKYSLKVYPYPSLAATTWFMGNAKTIDIQKILDYQFVENDATNQTFIFALPKYIYVNNEKVEYSNIDGESANLLKSSLPNRLTTAYKKKFEFLPMQPNTKYCLCDVLDYTHIPNIFCLGLQSVGDDEYSFELNTQHFCFTNDINKTKVLQKLEIDTRAAYKKYGTTNLPDLIVEAFIDYEKNKDVSTDDID